MIQIHCFSAAEADAAWAMLAQTENPAEVYLNGALLAVVDRHPVSRRMVPCRPAVDRGSALRKAQLVRSPQD
jgi:hypothetical protein